MIRTTTILLVLSLALAGVAAEARITCPDESVDVGIQISPATINLRSPGKYVTVHVDIPVVCVPSGPMELGPRWVPSCFGEPLCESGDPCVVVEELFFFGDNQGDLVVKYSLDQVKALLADWLEPCGGEVLLEVSGPIGDPDEEPEEYFLGEETVGLVDVGRE